MRGVAIPDRYGQLLVWTPPVKGRQYAIGVDTSGGQKGPEKENDPAAACVLDMATCEQVAEWSGFYIPVLWGWRVARLGWYYNVAHLAIETEPSPHGIAVYDACTRYGYPNLSCQLKGEGRDPRLSENKGWRRPAHSTEKFYNRIQEALHDGCIIRSESLIDELAGVDIIDGRVNKRAKNDRIIAYALALLARDQAYLKGEIVVQEKPIEDLADAYWRRQAADAAVMVPTGDLEQSDGCWNGV